MLPGGTLWRFYLAEPLRTKGRFTVETVLPLGTADDRWRSVSVLMPNAQPWDFLGGMLANAAFPKTTGGKMWFVPLMTPALRANLDDEIAIVSANEPISKWSSDGDFETIKADKAMTHLTVPPEPDANRPLAASFTLWTDSGKRAHRSLNSAMRRIASYAYWDGRIYHRIQFRLWHWRSRNCDLTLPADMQVLAAKVHDQWLDHLEVASTSATVRLSMPVDKKGEFVRFEILAQPIQKPHPLAPGMTEFAILRVHWPAPPMEVRTRLFLEDGLAPLSDPSLSRVGVPQRIAARPETTRWLQQAWNWGQGWLPISSSEMSARLEAQKNGVLLAEAKLRARPANR